MDTLEHQIGQWRTFVSQGPALDGSDVEELEGHLREQVAELQAAGLTGDEAFLVAVKRMGDLDALSQEFAREHSGRLWKQLLLSDGGAVTAFRQRPRRCAGLRGRCSHGGAAGTSGRGVR